MVRISFDIPSELVAQDRSDDDIREMVLEGVIMPARDWNHKEFHAARRGGRDEQQAARLASFLRGVMLSGAFENSLVVTRETA